MSLNVGVVGVGVRGRHSLEQMLAKVDGVRIGLVSMYPATNPVLLEGFTEEGARKYAANLGAQYVEDWREVVHSPDVDIISVMVEPGVAYPVIMEAIGAGKHVLCDKPVVKSPAEAEAVRQAVAESGLQLMVFLWGRYLPPFRDLKKQVEEGAIGNPIAVSMEFLMANGPLAGFTASAEYLQGYGGGDLVTFGCYGVDYICWLLGEPQALQARSYPYFYPDYQAVGMDSFGFLGIEFKNGGIGNLITGRTPGSFPIIRVNVTGETGVLRAEANLKAPGLVSGAQMEMVTDFISSIRSNKPIGNLPGSLEGCYVARVLSGAYEAIGTERTVLV